MPGGRRQALGIAWDSRSRQYGGGGSFSTRVASFPRPTRYTRPASIRLGITGARIVTPPTSGKSYDYQSRTYATTYSEIVVRCEGCHGPGSNHLAWARKRGHWSKLGALQDPVRAVGKRRRCSLVHRRISVQATWPTLLWGRRQTNHCRARIECGSPRSLLSPGALFARQGNLDHAEAELKSALAPNPSFALAAIRIRLLTARPPYRSR